MILNAMHQRLALAGYFLKPLFKPLATWSQFDESLMLGGDGIGDSDLRFLFASVFAHQCSHQSQTEPGGGRPPSKIDQPPGGDQVPASSDPAQAA